MPPRKSQPPRSSTRRTRQSTRRRETLDDGIPNVYGEMLAEALREKKAAASSPRSSKRRKLSEEPSTKIDLDFDLFGSSQVTPEQNLNVEATERLQQIVYDDFEGSEESEAEFEDVDLEAAVDEDEPVEKAEQKTLVLDLSKTNLDSSKRGIQRRKPVGPAERKLRLEVHRAHLVCLLAHLSCRNRWCESQSIHAMLKPLVPRKITALLHVDESKPQYQRSHSFLKGIEEVCAIWKVEWTITERGMRRAHWRADVDAVKESDDTGDLIDFEEFRVAAKSRSGSRDLGAQLLCALLRSVAVETRLVCSLQVLPFSGVAKGQTPEKPKPQYYHAPTQAYGSTAEETTTPRPSPSKAKRVNDSPFPIFWVEVYSPSTATWMPLDPIVRNTINKPKTGFEPPASDQQNSMTYVIAFEDDGSAKDVTRRYTQWYNAKTRKQRVESTKGGEEWWERTMRVYQKPFDEVRDEIEDAALLKRAETEPMPRNVQEFKGHPVYVLERHLRMSEVIQPKHEVGKVSTGTAKNAKLESVFRRRDVHLCRSADAWYRRGRDVKEGEQPLKRVVPKRKRDVVTEDFDEDDEANEGTALYAEYQTRLYEPPPVVNGDIPKNAYGNLDVYVPSMIPAGAVHVRHPLAAEAARVLDISYSDAVTGFEFKGRQGTAVVDGAVVSMNMCNAMVNVIEGLESEATGEATAARSRILLGLWKRWLTALRVRERVQREYGDKEEDDEATAEADADDDDDETYQDEDAGGGFMLEEAEPGQPSIKQPESEVQPAFPKLQPLDGLLPPEVLHRDIIVIRSPHKLPETAERPNGKAKATDFTQPLEDNEPGGFLPEADDGDEGGGFVPELEAEDGITGGGFLPGEDEEEEPARSSAHAHQPTIMLADADEYGGGFLPEDDEDDKPAGGASQDHTNKPRKTQHDAMYDTTGGFFTEDNNDPANAAAIHVEPSSPLGSIQKATAEESSIQVATPSGLPNTDTNPATPASENSLLSHDPDEEDAEPEWLLNSLGE
ncbi:xeroderma pigmentosum group C-complementing protein [Exophiala viscosa]|uniref:Xeroderma pigmentosum group C-complementing protein n=1 Tax=Exophiala viscosa TaxID=2486360 RepID=A0AAN6IAP6_9EURO|nr:xeroderma pigmentosum group C-complementing protein [Exophiala viscosa]